MPREHRITHPVLGPVTWTVLKAHAAGLRKTLGRRVCSWCFTDVPKGNRTRCGNALCTVMIEEITMWRACRNRAMRRAGYRCALCGGRAEEVDHIVPVKLGGTSDASNLRPLCLPCHRSETARLAKERASYKARTPYPKHVGAKREVVAA